MWFYPLKQMMGEIVNYDDDHGEYSERELHRRESQDVLNMPYVGKPAN